MRLSDAEREQIAGAASRLSLPLTSFVRQAALQASAVAERKVSVKTRERKAPDRKSRGVSFSARHRLTTLWTGYVCAAPGTSMTVISPACAPRAGDQKISVEGRQPRPAMVRTLGRLGRLAREQSKKDRLGPVTSP